MAGKYKVTSLDPRTPSISKVDHGEFRSYAAAAGVARILRKMNPIKTVVIEIPVLSNSRSNLKKAEVAVDSRNPDVYNFDSEPFHH